MTAEHGGAISLKAQKVSKIMDSKIIVWKRAASPAPGGGVLQLVACSLGVACEHFHGFQGEFIEVFAEEGDFGDEVVGHGDDVASHDVGLDEVEKFARAGPQEFHIRGGFQKPEAFLHERHGVAAAVGHASGEDRGYGWRTACERWEHAGDMRGGGHGGDIQLYAGLSKTGGHFVSGFAMRVGGWDFHIHILGPRGDFQGLAFHLSEFVAEDFEGNRQRGDHLQRLAGEGFVVADAGLAHEGGICGEAGDERVAAHFDNAGQARAVGEDFDLERGCHFVVSHLAPLF